MNELDFYYKKMVEELSAETKQIFKHFKPVGPDSDYDAEQIKKGMKVEQEHTTNKDITKMIAKHHLNEFPTYYTALDEMETKLKAKKPLKESLAPSEEEMITFFQHHPNPDDDTLHQWAELHGYDPHEVEEVVYKILTKKLQGEEK